MSLSDSHACHLLVEFCRVFFDNDEVANLCESDITFFEDHMEVVNSSKTDQHLDGARVVYLSSQDDGKV